MGKRGPKPKGQLRPVEVGSRQAERPKPLPGMSPRARAEWRRQVNDLPPGHFRAGDLYLLRAYCESYDLYVELGVELREWKKEHGSHNVATGTGSFKMHPNVAAMNNEKSSMASLAVKLGLSRSARRGEDKNEEKKPATPPKRKLFNG